MDSSTEKALTGLMNLLPDIYKDVAQPGLKVLGKAIGEALGFCTLPFNAVGTISDCTKLNLQHRLSEYSKKLEKVPEEKIVKVDTEIAVPVIQKMAYTTNQDIADLFTNLLASASNEDTAVLTHPGFENIISQLTPDEARIIQYLRTHDEIQYCELEAYIANGVGYKTLLECSTMIPYKIKLNYADNIHAYYVNLIRLGILVDMVNVSVASDAEYDEIKKVYKFDQFNDLIPSAYKTLSVHKSYYAVTDFGRMFINVCTDKDLQ